MSQELSVRAIRKRLKLLITGLLLALVVPVPASGEQVVGQLAGSGLEGYEIVTATTDIDTSTPKEVMALCPAGKNAIGGGTTVLGNIGGTVLTASSPSLALPTSQWYGGANVQGDASNPWGLQVDVICVDSTAPEAGYVVVEEMSTLDSVSPKTISAVCPDNMVVVGGGARVEGNITEQGLTMSVPGEGPSPREWRASAQEMSETDVDWSLRVYAYCAEHSRYMILTRATSPGSSTVQSVSTASCGRFAGGGAQLLGEDIAGRALFANTVQGMTWGASAHVVDSAPGPWGLEAAAFCTAHPVFLPFTSK